MTTYILLLVFHFAVLLIAPIFMIGIINRIKSIWSGRRGPKLYQSYFDLIRLLRKQPVYSEVTSWIFPLAPTIVLGTTIVAGLLSPVVAGFTPFAFPIDFILFAYTLALGKLFMMLGALDTGSAFEGMGASREATYSALAEPVFLLGLGTLAWASHSSSFQTLVAPTGVLWLDIALRITVGVAIFGVLLIEACRVPADDPTTHLELTMVHEVMILDHSGPELAFVQYAAAMKLTIFSGIIASILNPLSLGDLAETSILTVILSALISIAIMAGIAAIIGLIESLIARLRFRTLPLYTMAAFVAVVISLVVVNANRGLFQ